MTLPAMPALFRRLILRPMLAHRLRTAVTALGVTLGVAVVLAIQLANAGSLRGFSAALDAVSGKAALEITCPPLGLDERLLGEMSWLREFGIAAPVVEADVALANGRAEVVRLIGIDALRDPALRDYALKTGPQDDASSGMELMRFLSEPDAALITRSLAEKLGLSARKKQKSSKLRSNPSPQSQSDSDTNSTDSGSPLNDSGKLQKRSVASLDHSAPSLDRSVPSLD
ncbi:MAG: ABC transporter permease, partial [Prosthecobacter sp.]|nr:ABC transporter permease [Prosthecobacter sp.]